MLEDFYDCSLLTGGACVATDTRGSRFVLDSYFFFRTCEK